MSEDLYDEGYCSVWNVDNSSVVIKQMEERNAEMRPSLIWATMDVTKMDYTDEFFDIIIDKTTLDCIQTSVNSRTLLANTMKECQRVLKTGGCFISVSFTAPKERLKHLRRPFLDFDLKIHEIIKEWPDQWLDEK